MTSNNRKNALGVYAYLALIVLLASCDGSSTAIAPAAADKGTTDNTETPMSMSEIPNNENSPPSEEHTTPAC